MAGPDADAIKAARAAFNATLPDLATISNTSTGVSTRGGGKSNSGTTLQPNVPARLQAGTGSEAIYADRLGNQKGWTVWLGVPVQPDGISVDTTKLPTVDSTIAINGLTLQVIDVVSGQTWQVAVQVVCASV